MKKRLELAIEIDEQDRYLRSASVWHRGVLIVLNGSCRGWVACVEFLDGQVSISEDKGGCEWVRCEYIMQKNDGEEEIQYLYEQAVRCIARGVAPAAAPCACPGENLTAGCNDAGVAFLAIDGPGLAWTEEFHNGWSKAREASACLPGLIYFTTG